MLAGGQVHEALGVLDGVGVGVGGGDVRVGGLGILGGGGRQGRGEEERGEEGLGLAIVVKLSNWGFSGAKIIISFLLRYLGRHGWRAVLWWNDGAVAGAGYIGVAHIGAEFRHSKAGRTALLRRHLLRRRTRDAQNIGSICNQY